MPISVDDLRIGLWIAIYDIKKPEQEESIFPDVGYIMLSGQPQPPKTKPWEKYVVDGLPYMVLAINLPFVIVWDGVCDRLTCLDIRYLEFMALSQDYVHAIMISNKSSGYLVPEHLPKDVYGVSNSKEANRTKWMQRQQKQPKKQILTKIIKSPPNVQNVCDFEITTPPDKEDPDSNS